MTALKHFHEKGYALLGPLFDEQEVELLKSIILNCDEMNERFKLVKEKLQKGEYPSFDTIYVMNDVFSDNIFALACRKPPIIDFISEAFNDDAYLYHSKVPLKYPQMAGFKYHQDYYYWYTMGCLKPNMATCFIAIDKADTSNGCLKVIPGSHKCGRIDHVLHNGFSDSECDPVRVELLKERYGEVNLELNPGEVAIFHCNLLHSSDTNLSDNSRLALLGCFNTRNNSPFIETEHPSYAKQERFHGTLNSSMIPTDIY